MKKIVCSLLILGIELIEAQNDKLWYNRPAAHWNEALPLGNGKMGAMIYGNPYEETIQLNEGTFWSGSPHTNFCADGEKVIDEIRKLQFEKNFEAARDLIQQSMLSKNGHGMMFVPVGNLRIQAQTFDEYSDYKRELDLQKGIATTTYSINGVRYMHEAFISYPDEAMVVRLTADKPKSINTTVWLETTQKGKVDRVGTHTLLMDIISPDLEGVKGGVRMNVFARVEADGGQILPVANAIQVRTAEALTVYLSMHSNYKSYNDLSADPNVAIDKVEAAQQKGYNSLRKIHIEDFSSFYNRSSLTLIGNRFENLPTNERLKNYEKDSSLPALIYQFGRYLLIAGSRAGGQPMNLQGLWNGDIRPAWDSKYTININTQMNYWPAEVTNLSEMHQPLFDMLQDLSVSGQETAQKMYGADGWVAHHNTDLWRTNGIVDGATWGAWPYGGIWLAQHIWYHYLYTGDKNFLADNFKVLEGASAFLCDFLVKEPEHGWMVGAPSISPENTPKEVEGYARINYGCTMDNQLAADMFYITIRAGEVLHKKIDSRMRSLLKKLPPMQIGKYGQLQEWMWDWDAKIEHQSHISHLYGCYPSNQISNNRTPELADAVRKSLTLRDEISNTSWGNAWRVNQWARLHDGEKSLQYLQLLMRPAVGNECGGSMPNLFSSIMSIQGHSCFQIEANLGATAGIAEMLLQSHDGAIDLLPALPGQWSKGSVKGLKARGGFVIDMEWENNRIVSLKIFSALGGVCRIRTKELLGLPESVKLANGTNLFFDVPTIKSPLNHFKRKKAKENRMPTYTVSFSTRKGENYYINDY